MENSRDTLNLLGFKLLIVLYCIISIIPRFEAIDPIGSQWFYFGVINLLGLIFFYNNRTLGVLRTFSRVAFWFFGIYLVFFVACLVSIFGSLNISEGVKDIARVGITLVGVFNLYLIFKVAPHRLFAFLVKTLHVIVFVIGVQIIFHFIDNWSVPRTVPLLKETELLFGSRNVTAAFLSITLPFIISGVLKHAGRWRVMSLLTLFVSFTALFYVGARAAVLSATVIFSLFIIYFIIDGVRSGALAQRLKYPLLPIIGILIAGFLLVTNSNRLDRSKANSYKNILTTSYRANSGAAVTVKPTQSVTSTKSSGRLLYYKMAMDDFKRSPLVGIGLGNWKLGNKDAYYSQSNTDRFLYPLRVHNDFLQILAEAGILGFIPYVLLFIMLSGGILLLFFKNQDSEKRWTFLMLALALIAYGLDASINFPLERTPIQGLFAILAALIISLMETEGVKVKSQNEKTKLALPLVPVLIGLGIVGLVAAVISYAKYDSYVNQNYIVADTGSQNLMTADYVYSYGQARGRIDGFFEISGAGRPNEHVMAMYAMSEGNNKLALQHLDKSIAIAPNQYESKMLKAIIFGQRQKNLDSAIYYAKQGFEKYPAIKNNYVILLNAYREKGDTVNYFKTYDARLERFPNDVQQWKAKASRVFEFYKDTDRAAAIVDQAIKINPSDSSLVLFREKFTSRKNEGSIRAWYKKGFDFINEKKYPEAKREFLKILAVTPSNNPTLLNLGIIEVKMKQYEDAVAHLTKVIDAKAFKDGRPEYNRAVAYERLGNSERAKRDYRVSKKKGYKLAQNLPKSKLE
ncbi:O-antigen ligase family protein [Dokdonia genika]|uniref:O-antigen ligase family protein n=1 Tax=Dokdonia genika TaxID=308113 RepID=A0ABV9L6T1_9FLAO